MKILLLGEYSGVHKNLKDGLRDLGHDPKIASNGDGYKNIPCDINFKSTAPSFLGKIISKLLPLWRLNDLKGFDVVQLMNPFIFYHPLFPWHYFYQSIAKSNGKFFMLAAGDDAYFWRYGRQRMRYGPFDDFLKYDLKSEFYYMESDKSLRVNNEILDMVDGVVPIMYEYEVSYRDHAKKLKTIPIPINIQEISYQDNLLSGKLVVFHGLNRYGFKGTRHVEKAFDFLRAKYPNDLELIIDGGMPLESYLKIMRRTNVVIDQTNSYSLGVNGVYAMAMGKVVLGGAEPESLKSLGAIESPVVNIKPDSDSIIFEIEKIMENKNLISDIGFKSRLFAERHHSHLIVAEQYLEVWRGNNI